jgi:hypothetical protein
MSHKCHIVTSCQYATYVNGPCAPVSHHYLLSVYIMAFSFRSPELSVCIVLSARLTINTGCRQTKLLVYGLRGLQQQHHEMMLLHCAEVSRTRAFRAWRARTRRKMADWQHTSSLARTRYKLRMQGVPTEQQWHQQFTQRRYVPCIA